MIQWIIARLPKFSPIWIPCSNWPPKSCLVYILKTELENTSQWFVMLSYNSCPIVVCLVQVIKSLIKISKKIIDIYIYTMWKYFFLSIFKIDNNINIKTKNKQLIPNNFSTFVPHWLWWCVYVGSYTTPRY